MFLAHASRLAKRDCHIGTHISLVASLLPFRWREQRIWVFLLSHVAGGDGAQILSRYVIETSLRALCWFDGRLQWSRRLALASVQNTEYSVQSICCTEYIMQHTTYVRVYGLLRMQIPCAMWMPWGKLFVSSLLPELVVAPECQVRPDPPRHQLVSAQ